MRRFLWALAATAALTACDGSDDGTQGLVPGVEVSVGEDTTAGGDASTADTTGPGADAVADSGPTADAAGPDAAPTPDASPDSGPDATPVGPITVIDLGDLPHDAATGRTAMQTFTLPDDAVAFAINLVGSTGVTYVVDDLTAPDGQKLSPRDWVKNPQNAGGQICFTCVNRMSSAEAASSVLVPIAPTLSVAPGGTYTFEVAAFTSKQESIFSAPVQSPIGGSVQVSVAVRRAAGFAVPQTGVIDLNLFFTGSDGLNAGGAPFDTRMVAALEDFRTVYALMGITVGRITYTDIDPSLQVMDGYLGQDSDFELIARATAGAPPGVNVVIVREIVDSSNPFSGFGVILGIAGGIPGPVGLSGVGRSAVIVDGSPPAQTGIQGFGNTMAHEVGHYLGLYHSTESALGGATHDPIPDSPQNDNTNFMYNEGAPVGATASPGQGQVVRGNPVIRNSEEAP